MKRFCKNHKKEILNEDDNNGKYYCAHGCSSILASRTYTEVSYSKVSPGIDSKDENHLVGVGSQ